MQTSIDMFVAEKNGGMDWMTWSYGEDWPWDDELRQYFIQTATSADTILLSSKLAEQGYIDHWTNIAADTKNPQSAFAVGVRDAHKVIFSYGPKTSHWHNAEVVEKNLKAKVNTLKSGPGKNIIAFGGAGFASSLIEEDLVDEYHLIINPIVLGEGLPIFQKVLHPKRLRLAEVKSYTEGIVVTKYTRLRLS